MRIKKGIIAIIILMVLMFSVIFSINFYVKLSTEKQIITNNDYSNLTDIDCILVLGAGVRGNQPSPMLEARIQEGVSLYKKGVAPKIIMSGDHANDDYDEVNVMKSFAIHEGVPSEDIFMDHFGISTYDSIYRVKEIFGAKKIVIVTQKYHLYRALYIANQLGIEAYGVGADPRKWSGATYRELREFLARNKDFVKSILKPKSTYVGDAIPVSGSGDVTNDRQ